MAASPAGPELSRSRTQPSADQRLAIGFDRASAGAGIAAGGAEAGVAAIARATSGGSGTLLTAASQSN